MGEYHVVGGNRLFGETRIHGGKNAILPILASVVLNKGISVIHDCPRISDTFIAIEILEAVGCKVDFTGSTIIIDSSTADNCVVPENPVREMRSSIIFLGGILGRFKKVEICYPGGCELGARPIDLHLKALKEMNTNIIEDHGIIICDAPNLTGTRINLDYPSVGATENVMLTATLAEGETIISNAAKEPEITDLQNFLNSMGADIKGAGSDTIVIKGVKELHDVEYTVMPDRIVAGTFMTAAAMTDGEVILRNVIPNHIVPVTSKLLETGCEIKEWENEISIKAPKVIKPVSVRTYPHPGFPTDMQSQIMSYLVHSKGTSIVVETVFESRNKHVSELIRMGADIVQFQDSRTSVIKGPSKLHGTTVEGKDLRGGAALILAGLTAEGKTIVKNSHFVERGYENIVGMIRDLGGDIKFVE